MNAGGLQFLTGGHGSAVRERPRFYAIYPFPWRIEIAFSHLYADALLLRKLQWYRVFLW
jgi:hypothetical protein